jgi:hypothetical protein
VGSLVGKGSFKGHSFSLQEGNVIVRKGGSSHGYSVVFRKESGTVRKDGPFEGPSVFLG